MPRLPPLTIGGFLQRERNENLEPQHGSRSRRRPSQVFSMELVQ
jgi:hypothetical protein